MYGRELDGEVTTFETTGYTFDHTFVLYDRGTESVWYPTQDGAFTAISGPARGSRVEYLEQPEILTLGEWLERHPDSRVLLESAPEKTTREVGFDQHDG